MLDWIEKRQIPIAVGLIVFIAIGSIALLYEKQRDKLLLSANKPSLQEASLEEKIDELNSKIAGMEKQLKNKPATPASGQIAGVNTSQSSAPAASGIISINSADATALDSLPGIGPAKATAIIEYRNANGGFKSLEDLKNVKGIGDATFEKLKSQISL